jgi:hypothetical protein
MLLAPNSHERLEKFFRHHLHDESLQLPRAHFYAGHFAAWLTRAFGISAITLGGRVLVTSRLMRRDGDGRTSAPAWLVVHETAHVLQYRRAGVAAFLFRYLREYAGALRKEEGLGVRQHRAAYRAISFEAQARAAEEAYAAWSRRAVVAE